MRPPPLHPDPSRHRDDPHAAGDYMRALRLSVGATQTAWAVLLDVSERTVRQWETHRLVPSYAQQYTAESVLRAAVCARIERDVRAGDGCDKGVRLAWTLYLSDRAMPQTAAQRGVEYSRGLRS